MLQTILHKQDDVTGFTIRIESQTIHAFMRGQHPLPVIMGVNVFGYD